ncbi:MAG TPA: hypothetical protein DCL63_10050 [Firmicutes bacterium]|nr:hypothetical protein [Bacillota bacterium]HBK59281.1 hypothetical protein [Bacillota bacterium]
MGAEREAKLSRAEEHLCQLPGVTRVRIVQAAEGDEIHVMVAGHLDQDEIKRMKKDIETIYLLDVGERVDYRKVSIAQVSAADDDGEHRATSRPVLSRIALEYGPSRAVTVHIHLDYMGQSHVGEASGCSDGDCICDIVKAATVDALESMMGGGYRLQASCEVSGDRVISEVVVTDVVTGQRNRYIGAAYRKEDVPTSVARSVLQALNRQLERLSARSEDTLG